MWNVTNVLTRCVLLYKDVKKRNEAKGRAVKTRDESPHTRIGVGEQRHKGSSSFPSLPSHCHSSSMLRRANSLAWVNGPTAVIGETNRHWSPPNEPRAKEWEKNRYKSPLESWRELSDVSLTLRGFFFWRAIVQPSSRNPWIPLPQPKLPSRVDHVFHISLTIFQHEFYESLVMFLFVNGGAIVAYEDSWWTLI